MSKRRPNPRLAKIHRNYTVEEVATLYGIHKNTVRGWIKKGLRTIDDKRPMLILGYDLAAFLQARRAKNKCICKLSVITIIDVVMFTLFDGGSGSAEPMDSDRAPCPVVVLMKS